MATKISSSVDQLTGLLGKLEGLTSKLGTGTTAKAAPAPAAAAKTTTAAKATGGTDKTELLKTLLPLLLSKMQGTGGAAAPQLGGIPTSQGSAITNIQQLQNSTAQDVQTRLRMTLFNPATNGGYSQDSLTRALQFAGLGGGSSALSGGLSGLSSGFGGLGGGFGGGMGGFGSPIGGFNYANDPLGIGLMASGQSGLPGLYGISGITGANDATLFGAGGVGNIAIQAGLAASPIAQSLEKQAQQAFAQQTNNDAQKIQMQIQQLLIQRDQIAQAALIARQQGADITQMLLMIQQIPMAIQQLQMQSQQLFVKAQKGPLGGLFG